MMMFYSMKKFLFPVLTVILLLAFLRGMNGGWENMFTWTKDAGGKGEQITEDAVNWTEDKLSEVTPKGNPVEAWLNHVEGDDKSDRKSGKKND